MLLDYILNDKYIVVDIETTSLNPRQGKILSVAWHSKDKQGIALDYKALPTMLPELLDLNIAKVFHNANFDLSFFHSHGIESRGPILDTLLLAQLVNENRELGLKALAQSEIQGGEDPLRAYKKITNWCLNNKKKKGDYTESPIELLSAYNSEDVKNTYQIAKILACKLMAIQHKCETVLGTKGPVDYYEEEMQLFDNVLLSLNIGGISIDVPAALQKQQELKNEKHGAIFKLEGLLKNYVSRFNRDWHDAILASYSTERGRANCQLPKFNWDSTKQVGKLFFVYMDLQKYHNRKTPTGAWKCDELSFRDALQIKSLPEILRQACESYLDFIKVKTKLAKIGGGGKGKGLLGKLEDGRLYPTFKQVGGDGDSAKGTVTGRISSSPNCQNQEEWEKIFYVPDP